MVLAQKHVVGTIFTAPPQDYSHDRNSVHVWRAYFEQNLISYKKYKESLSVREIDKARRFIRHSDRGRYVFAHGVLRAILSSYMGCAPHQIVFESNKLSKPCLANAKDGNEIQFNLSHSGDITLIAVSQRSAIGIDVEYIRMIPDAHQIVNSTFSVQEREYLNNLPSADYEKRFFACWTAKEAFLKATGRGLSYPLDKFSIIFSNGLPSGVKFDDDNPFPDKCWRIIGLSPGPGYSGAMAIAELQSELKFYEYSQA